MIFGGKGGGNTKTGLVFEGTTDLSEFLNSQKGYKVENGNVYFNGKKELELFLLEEPKEEYKTELNLMKKMKGSTQ